MKRITPLAVGLASALALAACSSSSSPSASPSQTPAASNTNTTAVSTTSAPATTTSAGKKLKVGFSVYDMQYEYFQAMEKGTKAAVAAKGWDYVLHNEKSDANEMVTGAENLINNDKIDVLIISPFKPDALGPIVALAKSKNVPVIIDDIGGGGVPYDAIVISDNSDGGKQAADFMDKQVQKNGVTGKKVVSIQCEPEAVYAARRNQAFDAEIKAKGYTIATELSGHSKAEEATKIMKDALAKDPDVVGVFACNDNMADAAAQAIKAAGKDPVKQIAVVGFNADPLALTDISKGVMAATIAQDPAGMGKLTVDLAEQITGGKTVSFSNAQTKEVFNPITLVSADNVATFLKK